MLLGIILFLIGLLMLIKPKIVWQITEEWKSYDATEPSDFYIKSTRFGGVMFLLVGVGSLIAFFLQ